MRRIEMMTAGGVTLGGLGVLVGLAIGSGTAAPKVVAQRAQPIEVRTQVIRKTVNVYRRAKPPHVAAAGPGGKRTGSASSAVYAAGGAPTTRTSGIKSAGTGSYAPAPVVSTRTSGSKSTSGSSSQGSGSGSGTVKTRTSGGGASGGSGSARTVSTKSSGGGGDNGGGHDD